MLAGFWRRWLACFVDCTIVGIVIGLLHLHTFGLAVVIAYYGGIVGWTHGRTLGAMLLGIRIVREDGGEVSYGVAFIRALMSVVSNLCCGLGYLWAAWDPQRRTWHDKVAGTIVVMA